jgi:hypothetical protein
MTGPHSIIDINRTPWFALVHVNSIHPVRDLGIVTVEEYNGVLILHLGAQAVQSRCEIVDGTVVIDEIYRFDWEFLILIAEYGREDDEHRRLVFPEPTTPRMNFMFCNRL